MPNITPDDAHVKRPLTAYTTEGTTGVPRKGSKSFSNSMDKEWKSRKQQRKKKVKQIEYTPDWVAKMLIEKKFHSAENRRALAAKGHALRDGSYPIADADDLHSAYVLARSGHGNVAAAKRLIARRAKQLGVSNPFAKQPKMAMAKSFIGEDSIFQSATSCFSRLTE